MSLLSRFLLTSGLCLSALGCHIFGDCSGPSMPIISVQPQGQTVVEGDTVTFSIQTDGQLLQWKKDGVALRFETTSQLVISPVTPAQAGSYTVDVSNAQSGDCAIKIKTVTSEPAILTVTPKPIPAGPAAPSREPPSPVAP